MKVQTSAPNEVITTSYPTGDLYEYFTQQGNQLSDRTGVAHLHSLGIAHRGFSLEGFFWTKIYTVMWETCPVRIKLACIAVEGSEKSLHYT